MGSSGSGDQVRIGYRRGATPLNNVISFLERNADASPDRAAIRWVERDALSAWDGRAASPFAHRQITFREFRAGIVSVACGLSDLGIRKGDRVIIFLPMGVLMYTAMFAVQRLGAIAVFLDSWARRNHLGAGAACCTPKAMISHAKAFDLVRDVPEFQGMPIRVLAGPGDAAGITARLEPMLRHAGECPVEAVESETTALITFTTGSSGTPKGANRTHRFLAAQHEALTRILPYAPSDVDLPAFPIFSLNNFAAGVSTCLPALDLAAPSERDPAILAAQLLHEGVTCATLSPSMFVGLAAFCREQGLTLDGLRRAVTGGAPISRDSVQAFKAIAPQAEIWILYGSTEVEPMAHIEAAEMLALSVDPDPEIVEDGVNVGRISGDLRYKFIRIVRGPVELGPRGWDELETPPGEVGEFVVSGDHVCRDYYNNEEAFRRAKIVGGEGRVWHRTGDLARLDDDGFLWVVGRIHNVIERGNRYYFPVRAEVVLGRIPFVKRGAFLGLPDPELGERTAVVVELDRSQADEARARAEAGRLLARNGIPMDAFFVVDRIPMDPRHHSKVEYEILRQQLQATGAA